jgi:hypothetical protein
MRRLQVVPVLQVLMSLSLPLMNAQESTFDMFVKRSAVHVDWAFRTLCRVMILIVDNVIG